MANEYCMNCSWATGSGPTLYCNWHHKYVNRLDTCSRFARHSMMLDAYEEAGSRFSIELRGSGPAVALALPLRSVQCDIVSWLWRALRE